MENTSELNPRDRRILTVTCFGHFLSHFNMLTFPAVLLPLAARMNLDMAEVLGYSTWMYLMFGLTALPWGVAADRWGPSLFLKIFFLGAGICGFAAAFWIDSPLGFTLSLTGIGVFSGIYHPAGLGWISKEITRVSRAMAFNGMFGNLGLASAPLFAGIVNWIWGPKAVYMTLGILNLAGMALMLFFHEGASGGGAAASGGDRDASVRAFAILLVAMMLGGIAYRGATVILPPYFELKNQAIFDWVSGLGGGISENLVATISVSFLYLVGMVGQYTGGRVAEQFELRRCYLVFHAITIPFVTLMYFATDLPLILLAVIYIFFLLGMQPIENTLVARFTPKKFHSAAYGTKFILTFGVGAVAVKAIKEIKLGFGIETVFPFLGLVSLMLVTVVMILIVVSKPVKS